MHPMDAFFFLCQEGVDLTAYLGCSIVEDGKTRLNKGPTVGPLEENKP